MIIDKNLRAAFTNARLNTSAVHSEHFLINQHGDGVLGITANDGTHISLKFENGRIRVNGGAFEVMSLVDKDEVAFEVASYDDERI